MKKVSAYFALIRPLNFLITFITVLVAAAICYSGVYPWKNVLIAALSASLTLSAGNVINDILDIDIDKVAHPDRPLASGAIDINPAFIFYTIVQLVSLVLSMQISQFIFTINFFAGAILFFYTLRLKQIMLLKNIVVAGLTGLVFIYGGIAAGNFKYSPIPAFFAFLINMTREIVKDMVDSEGDLQNGIISFPIKVGTARTKNTLIAIIIFLITFTFYPYLIGVYNKYYLLIIIAVVIPVLIYFLYSLVKDDSKKNLSKLSKLLKLDMVFGLIAIYLGR